MPGAHVVGATLTDRLVVQLWYVKPTSGSTPVKTRYSLHKQPPLRFQDESVASQFAASLRQGCCWWGRPSPPRLLAVVNPSSGTGHAASQFDSDVLPVLRDAAGMAVTVVRTEGPGHAVSLVEGLDVATHDVIVVVGGDGSVHEVLQGLMRRRDWATAVGAVALAHLPGGSGNGLAASAGCWDMTTGALALCKGNVARIDVASVLQPPATRLYSFLDLTYGLISNLDQGTEALRFMGELRFTVGALGQVMTLPQHCARLSFLPADPSAQPLLAVNSAGATVASSPRTHNGDGGGGMMAAASTSAAVDGTAEAAAVLRGSFASSISAFPAGPPLPVLQAIFEGSGGHGGGQSQPESPRTRHRCVSPNSSPLKASSGYTPQALVSVAAPLSAASASAATLTTVVVSAPESGSAAVNGTADGPMRLPHGWHQMDFAQLQLLVIGSAPYISMSTMFNPRGALDSGSLDLQVVQGMQGVGGRLALAALLLAADDGKHVHHAIMQQSKVRAYLLEPLDNSSWVMADGEVLETKPTYVELHPNICRLLVAPSVASGAAGASASGRTASGRPRAAGEPGRPPLQLGEAPHRV